MKIATIKNFGLFTSPFTGNTMRKTNPRKIDYFEFEYIFTAKGTFYLDNKVYDIQDNMILVKKPNQIAYSCFSIKCFYLYIELDKSSEFYDFLMNISSFYSIIDPTVYNRIFQDLIKHLTITNNPEDDYINSKLLELFYFLKIDEDKNRTISKSSYKNHNQLIYSAIKYINQNFSKKISLKTLSNEIGYSQNYLQHIFKSIMGITPQQYLENIRINQAKYLLTLPDHTLQEISDLCGFDSQAYFSHIFKKHTRYTPKAYRKLSFNGYKDYPEI